MMCRFKKLIALIATLVLVAAVVSGSAIAFDGNDYDGGWGGGGGGGWDGGGGGGGWDGGSGDGDFGDIVMLFMCAYSVCGWPGV
ncbi:MAG: hypothetical protein FWG45_06270, partial [Oscillospiraceae bacterium]|nr:hypothetical protein [Oscillospiraceae bacterium]